MNSVLLLLSLLGACAAGALPHGVPGPSNKEAVRPLPPLKVDLVPGAPAHRQERIINGFSAEGPSIAALVFGVRLCGGTLITKRTILTAAHCTNGANSVTAYLGSGTLYAGKAFQSTNFKQHPGYNGQPINDVALIIFSEDIEGENIATACLSCNTLDGGETAFPCGWGSTRDGGSESQDLRCVFVTVITPAVCAIAYGSSVLHESVVCSQGHGNNGVCTGDSGGPLMLATSAAVIGVISFSAEDACEEGYPSGYMRVSYMCEWIKENAIGDLCIREPSNTLKR